MSLSSSDSTDVIYNIKLINCTDRYTIYHQNLTDNTGNSSSQNDQLLTN